MEFFWPRTNESSGVENTPYVRACIRKTALWLKGFISFEFFILLFCKICFLQQSALSVSRSLSKCRLHGFKAETSNSVHYLTNFRSTLLVTSRISCYEVACARLSESRDAAKIGLARSGGGCGPRAFFESLFTAPLSWSLEQTSNEVTSVKGLLFIQNISPILIG